MVNAVRVAIAHHSGRGHTARLAEAVGAGAGSVAEAAATLINVDGITQQQWSELDAADAIIFGSPTYMGSASAAFHTFAQASSRRFLSHAWRDKVAAGFTNSGSMSGDKNSTLGYFATLAAQHGMVWVTLGLHAGWNTSAGSEFDLNRLGFFSGAGAQSNMDSSVDGVHKSDLATAEHLGRRVAEFTRVVAAGRAALAGDS